MWFNFLTTLHLPRDSKRKRWRLTRPRVVTRAHVGGLGWPRMDQGPGAHSDGERALGSIVAMVREGGHHLPGSHESWPEFSYYSFAMKSVSKTPADPSSTSLRLS